MNEGTQSLAGRKIAVVGLGARTGVSLVRFLCAAGAEVTAYDGKPLSGLAAQVAELRGLRYTLRAGEASPDLTGTDLVLLSPGVPAAAPFLESARGKGIPVWSEIEFAFRRLAVPVVAVTGSNGKSTTTSLIGHLLAAWGKSVFTGGNLGNPLVNAVGRPYDFAVAEVSSFQLEAVDAFRPRVAVLLNVSPNHLDRHGTVEAYAAAKERIFRRMEGDDRALLSADDAWCREIAPRVRCPRQFFSAAGEPTAELRAEAGEMVLPGGVRFPAGTFRLPGRHNLENALAAAGAALSLGCPPEVLRAALGTFAALPHRLQVLGTHGGLTFVNDSKSTTPEASIVAVRSFDAPVLLLAGGRAKVREFGSLARAAAGRARTVFLYGEAAALMEPFFLRERVAVSRHGTLREAFEAACGGARAGEIVLLSPANASFDQFRDFEHRGAAFTELVRKRMAS